MTDALFTFFQRLHHRHSGQRLAPDKRYLLETRLARLMRQHGFSGLGDLADSLQRRPSPALEREVIEALTTNETYFFRDRLPFQNLARTLLPGLIASRARTRRISIWSAAASTGQEAYSIAMLLDDFREQLAGWTVEILATDLSTTVISRAREGLYTQFEVQRGLPIRHLLRYFTKEGESWRISSELRRSVRFEQRNLIHDLADIGRMDVILCRNVLIYFETSTRQEVLNRISRQLAPDGALILGGAETVLGLDSEFVHDRAVPGLFRLKSSADVRIARVA